MGWPREPDRHTVSPTHQETHLREQGRAVYIDDGSDSGELKIDVDGHEYTEQENLSYAGDGVLDSVTVDSADGGHLVYTDTDHDGSADLVTEYDAHDDAVEQAHYDAATGQWIDVGADHATVTDAAHTGGTDTITVDTANGQHGIGPATVDTNDDGHPDTAVVHDAKGDTVLYTDSKGDGQADVATELTPDGQVVIAEHTGAGQWTVVEHGHLTADGQLKADDTAGGEFAPPLDAAADQAWSDTDGDESGWAAPFSRTAFSETGSAQGVVRIDATTGQWISRN